MTRTRLNIFWHLSQVKGSVKENFGHLPPVLPPARDAHTQSTSNIETRPQYSSLTRPQSVFHSRHAHSILPWHAHKLYHIHISICQLQSPYWLMQQAARKWKLQITIARCGEARAGTYGIDSLRFCCPVERVASSLQQDARSLADFLSVGALTCTPSKDGLTSPKGVAFSTAGRLVVTQSSFEDKHEVCVYRYNTEDYKSLNTLVYYAISIWWKSGSLSCWFSFFFFFL